MQHKKILKIQKAIRQEKLSGLILGNFGFTMFDELLYYILLETPELALIYIPQRGKPTLYVIPFEVAQRQRSCPNMNVRPLNKAKFDILRKHIKKGAKTGLHLNRFPISTYEKLKRIKGCSFVPFESTDKIVSIKLPEEVNRLKEACRITDSIFKKITKEIKKCKTEKEVVHRILLEGAKHGVEPSFPPIVASGKNAADPHYMPGNNSLKKGFCVIDMGVRFEGYCSDMTRTIYIGKPKKKEVELYEKLLNIQKKSIKLVNPGVRVDTIDKYVRKELGKTLDKQFIHGLGHGLGTQVHEWPSVSSRQNTVLEEGMCITIEPGVYKQGKYGIRIEDDIVVTKKGPQVLNSSPKKLITV